MATTVSPFEVSAAWHSNELGSKDDLAFDLERRHLDALLDALIAHADVQTEALTPESFPLRSIEADLGRWIEAVKEERGIVLLRGLELGDLSADEAARLFFGLGSHFGVAVSQNNLGDKIGHVVNLGGQDRNRRAYQNARRLHLHTDRCDYVGMLCIRPAHEGGISGYASALTIHNEILASRPELLEPLYEGFKLHRFGEQSGESPLTQHPIPVFSEAGGYPNVVYIRGYIDLAVDEGHYVLTDQQQEALDYFDEVANRSDVRFDMRLESGEATITNNALLLHNRTSFEDHPDESLKRHLVRLWLMDPYRPAVERVRAHKPMHGIEVIQGRGTYYQGQGFKNDNPAY